MIDTYMDRASWPTWMNRAPRPAVNYDDPRLYAGQLYNTVIDRMVAEAKDSVSAYVAWLSLEHKTEMCCGIPIGTKHSIFTVQGGRK